MSRDLSLVQHPTVTKSAEAIRFRRRVALLLICYGGRMAQAERAFALYQSVAGEAKEAAWSAYLKAGHRAARLSAWQANMLHRVVRSGAPCCGVFRLESRAENNCVMCGDPILDSEDAVDSSDVRYWLDKGDRAHRDCYNDALQETIRGRQDADDEWNRR
jgi:hypothetical protein